MLSKTVVYENMKGVPKKIKNVEDDPERVGKEVYSWIDCDIECVDVQGDSECASEAKFAGENKSIIQIKRDHMEKTKTV